MIHGVFETLNRNLKDVRYYGIMEEISVIITADFRLTLAVVPRRTLAEEVKVI